MKCYPVRFALKLLSILCILAVLSVGGYVLYGSVFATTYAASYCDKLARLQSLEGPKTVFVGGSSCMFGIRTKLFEEQTGIPSVNMAVNAGIPAKLYLESAADALQEGDALFVAFEYGYYWRPWNNYGESGINFLLYQDPSIVGKQATGNLLRAIPDFLMYGWNNWQNAVQEFMRYRFLGGFGVYSRDSVNENGDMVASKGQKNTPGLIAQPITYKRSEAVLAPLQAKLKEIAQKGVKVYIVFEPLMPDGYTESLDELYMELSGWENVTVLGQPKDYIYSLDSFFNSVEHLSYDAATKHTEKILRQYEAIQKS